MANQQRYARWVSTVMAIQVVSMLTAHAAVAVEGEADYVYMALPPRTIDDITRVLVQYKPNPELAIKAQAAANETSPITASRAALLEFYLSRARAAGQVGRVSQQIADYKKALEYGEPSDDAYLRAANELTNAEISGGNLLDALHHNEKLLSVLPVNKYGYLISLNRRAAYLHALLGDFDAAKRYNREMEAAFTYLKKSGNWFVYGNNWTSDYESGRGELFQLEGRYGEAEASFRRSLSEREKFLSSHSANVSRGVDVSTRDGLLRLIEGTERSIAYTLLLQGKITESEIIARQALRRSLERVGRASQETGQGLRLLGQILAEQGRFAESAKLAQASLDAFAAAGASPDSLTMAEARRVLGSALVAQRRYPEAIQVFEAMRSGVGNDPILLSKVGSRDLDWVLALLRTGSTDAAEVMASEMLDSAVRHFGADAPRTAEIRAFHAMALTAQGKLRAAFEAFNHSLPLLLDKARATVEEAGTSRQQQRLVIILEAYLRLLGLLREQRETLPPGFDIAGEAFRIADIARSSGVQRALAASAARARIDDPGLAALARKDQDLQQRIASLNRILTDLLSLPPDQQLPQIQEKMRTDIGSLGAQHALYKKEILSKFPDYAQLIDPQPASLADVRRRLRPGEVLVAWYFADQDGYAWAVRGDGESIFVPLRIGRKELAETVARLRRALDSPVATIDEIPPYDVASAYGLYRDIMAPLLSALAGSQTVLAVPHADLGQLPLAVLLTESASLPGKSAVPFAAYRNLPWLIRQVAIAQYPSVTAFVTLRSLRATPEKRKAFIGFGDPIFKAEQLNVARNEPDSETIRGRGMLIKRRNLPQMQHFDSASLALLPRLPDTADEIREVARVVGATDDDVFLQARASEKSVLSSNLSDRRIIMFATHGLVPGDLDGLREPALALSSPKVTGEPGDGLLTLEKILGLRLNADWVVLSACNTASGDGAGAEAVSGLGRAFFYAGTRALLVSNWPVETVSARLLMTETFRHQSGEPALRKADALRMAMLWMIDKQEAKSGADAKASYSYAHPLFWAPFVVVGD